ncbi:hypothetical protein [Jiangella muralis]|uniref:hypothetical protein n=1 Tax=Jiangella muralis TaxID=702383 RepID=UPI0012FC2CBE|nr:hypothetical protein [Jiangella muralis]
MSVNDRADTTRVAGTLRLSTRHIADVADETGGFRRRYGYLVESTDSGATYEGDDLRSGVGAPVDAKAAVRMLASFLSAAGESYRHVLEHPESEPENLDLFPLWVAEAAYLNADELAIFDLDDEDPDDGVGVAEPAKFIGVVFQQGDDAAEALEILNERGWHAAIEYLAQWDLGRETEETAKINGQVYDEVQLGERDTICVSGDYVMTYDEALGHVGLVRKIDRAPSSSPLPPVDAPGPAARRGAIPSGTTPEVWSLGESPWARPWSSPHQTGRPAHPPPGI